MLVKRETQTSEEHKDAVITPQKLIRQKKYPYWERVAVAFACIMLTIFPLFVLNGVRQFDEEVTSFQLFPWREPVWYYNLTLVKVTAFRVATLLFVAVCAMLFAAYAFDGKMRKLRRPDYLRRMTLPQIFLTAFVAWQFVAAFVARKSYGFDVFWQGYRTEDVMLGIRTEGIFHLLLYAAIFVLLSYWGEYSEKYLCGMGIMAALLGGLVLLQSCGSTVMYPENMNFWNTEFIGTLGNVDCLGGLCSIILPALFCGYVMLHNKYRYLCLIGLSLLSFGLFVTNVASGLLGMVAALAFVLPFMVDRKEYLRNTCVGLAVLSATLSLSLWLNLSAEGVQLTVGKKLLLTVVLTVVLAVLALILTLMKRPFRVAPEKLRKITALVLATLILIALVGLFFYEGESIPILHEAHELLHFRMTDETGHQRGRIWKNTISLIKQHPLVGSGPGTYMYEYEKCGDVQHVDMAHNDFLQIWEQSGFIGLALYVAFLLSLAVRTFKTAGRCPMLVVFAAPVVGYLVHSFFSFSIAIVTPLFWVCAGLLDKCIRQIPPAAPVNAG